MTDYNIANALHKVTARQGKQVALVSGSDGRYKEWSFQELLARSNQYAHAIEGQGVRRGDRVMLMVRPSMEFICLTFALFQMGAVVILIDPGMGYKNLLRCIASVEPVALIGIPQVQLFSRLFARPFKTVRIRLCVGSSFGLLGPTLDRAARGMATGYVPVNTERDELAAIIFTTGSTGPPKGVQYTHSIFFNQLKLIRDYYHIGPGDVDQPGFPLFALFSTALGATAVIPDMDPTRPAQVNPARFIRSIIDRQVTYSFGSPAIWNVVSNYCAAQNIRLPVRKILMAGAPVSGELISRVQQVMGPEGEVHTPYGATESLPVSSITGREVLADTWPLTRQGRGACVGRPLPGMTIRIIKPVDGPLADWSEAVELPVGEIGEIVVKGLVVTAAYDQNEQETGLAKIADKTGFWHRMGDMGHIDQQRRLWFCGRKAHRVLTEEATMYTICCEAIFNVHPRVFRSALVGVGKPGGQQPVIIVELQDKAGDTEQLFAELRQLAEASELTSTIRTFMVHPSFPVDIRHNAKIFREKLAVWAAQQQGISSCLDKDGL